MECVVTKEILWVDDDAPDRFEFESEMIRRNGWKLEFATDILQGAAMLRQNRYDIVLLDQEMAGSGVASANAVRAGYRLLCWLRGTKVDAEIDSEEAWLPLHGDSGPLEINRKVPVAFISAYAEDELIRKDASADQFKPLRFLCKPISWNELFSYLRKETHAEEAV